MTLSWCVLQLRTAVRAGACTEEVVAVPPSHGGRQAVRVLPQSQTRSS